MTASLSHTPAADDDADSVASSAAPITVDSSLSSVVTPRRCACCPAWCCSCATVLTISFRLLLLILFGLCVFLIIWFWSPLKHAFLTVLQDVSELKTIYAALILTAANIVAALMFLPCIPFTLSAGWLFGAVGGTLIISLASIIAAVLAFLSGRYLARSLVEKSLGGRNSKWRIIDSAIHSDGFRIVFLIRLSPIHPYGVMNYLFGLTSVTLFDYTVASFIAMLPTTMMEVYSGSALHSIDEIVKGEASLVSGVIFWVGMVVTIIVTVLITLWVRRKLKTELERYEIVSDEEEEEEEQVELEGIEVSELEPGSEIEMEQLTDLDLQVMVEEEEDEDKQLTEENVHNTQNCTTADTILPQSPTRASSDHNHHVYALPNTASRHSRSSLPRVGISNHIPNTGSPTTTHPHKQAEHRQTTQQHSPHKQTSITTPSHHAASSKENGVVVSHISPKSLAASSFSADASGPTVSDLEVERRYYIGNEQDKAGEALATTTTNLATPTSSTPGKGSVALSKKMRAKKKRKATAEDMAAAAAAAQQQQPQLRKVASRQSSPASSPPSQPLNQPASTSTSSIARSSTISSSDVISPTAAQSKPHQQLQQQHSPSSTTRLIATHNHHDEHEQRVSRERGEKRLPIEAEKLIKHH